MFEVTDVFAVLAWLLLCVNLAVIGFAALVEFGPRRSSSATSLAARSAIASGRSSDGKT